MEHPHHTHSQYTHLQHPHSQQQERKWIHAIQNESFRPKPAAFSPLGSREENPLLEQQRQCRDKLDALAHVRHRVGFLGGGGVQIHTRMILSQLECDASDHTRQPHEMAAAGIDALAGLEALLFAFLTHKELVRVSEVCRSWKDTARHNVIWEPLLVTPVERYPLRALLGVSKELPAIQVYMIFKRLRLGELPKELEKRSALDPRRNQQVLLQPAQVLPHRVRFAEERNRLLTLLRGAQDGRAAEVANVLPGLLRHRLRRGMQALPTSSPSPLGHSVHVLGFRGGGCGASTAVATPPDALDPLVEEANVPDQLVELLAAARNRPDREDELHFTKDGYRRTTLRVWLQLPHQRRKKLSEHTLRSFLRQLLLAIHALETAGATHAEVSTANIVVLEPASADTGDAAAATSEQLKCDATPLFQLDCSRNIVHVGAPNAGLPAAATLRQNLQQQQQRVERRVFEDMRDRREAHHAAVALVAALNEDMEGEDDILELAEDALDRQVHTPCMFNALFRAALSMWARGRYPDSSAIATTPLLPLLVLLHAHIPAGFRSFLEYGKFLIDSGLASAAHLINHAFVSADPHSATSIPVRMIQSQDVLDYQASVLAWYGNAHALAGARIASRQRQRDGEAASVAGERGCREATEPSLELMPRTQLAPAYLQHALKEPNLSRERFVSIQAPEIKSSSWIRKVAETQRHTLQRLDLSRVMLPTSVLLKELANLPRITHLRLPSKIERPDDLEHFLAALSCTDLLPNLRAMDANVKLAMDRMEQAYQEQLDMIEFLLARG